jgi:hypothetical protein
MFEDPCICGLCSNFGYLNRKVNRKRSSLIYKTGKSVNSEEKVLF